MKRIRRLLEPEKPRSIAGPLLGSALLIVTVALGLSAWQPQREPAPGPALTAQSKPQAEEMPRKEIASHYRKWADEDVVYIIDDRERAAFEQLRTDEERERFIEQFWERRDPTPGTLENEFKTEHYRRIAYANQRFAEPGLPGWRTARGRIYIVNGPPDEIEDHADRQAWRYRHLPGLGDNVDFLFKKDSNGQFELMPQAGRAAAADLGSGSVERALAVD